MQENPRQPERNVGYWSPSFEKAEQAHNTVHREYFNSVAGVLLHRLYLKGTQFIFRTDHKALRWILNIPDARRKLARCHHDYQSFILEVLAMLSQTPCSRHVILFAHERNGIISAWERCTGTADNRVATRRRNDQDRRKNLTKHPRTNGINTIKSYLSPGQHVSCGTVSKNCLWHVI